MKHTASTPQLTDPQRHWMMINKFSSAKFPSKQLIELCSKQGTVSKLLMTQPYGALKLAGKQTPACPQCLSFFLSLIW